MHEQIEYIRKNLAKHVGSRVRVTSRKSRKKVAVRQGVIESTYANIFVIRYDLPLETADARRASYSYVDILTHAVEIALYKEKVS